MLVEIDGTEYELIVKNFYPGTPTKWGWRPEDYDPGSADEVEFDDKVRRYIDSDTYVEVPFNEFLELYCKYYELEEDIAMQALEDCAIEDYNDNDYYDGPDEPWWDEDY